MLKLSTARFGLLAFAYSAAIALLVQFLVLPVLFPGWHAGDGLMKSHDWVTYHQIAAEVAQKIKTDGWRFWSIDPLNNGWAEPGVASAIYAVSFSKPWALIPFNAGVHALTVVLLFNIFLSLVPDRRGLAMLATLPFLFFPTSLMWVTQIHKDGAAILGATLFLWGALRFWTRREEPVSKLGWELASLCFGFWLANLIRPYWGDTMAILLHLLFVGWFFVSLAANFRFVRRALAIWVIFWFGAALVNSKVNVLFPGANAAHRFVKDTNKAINQAPAGEANRIQLSKEVVQAILNTVDDAPLYTRKEHGWWNHAAFLPSQIDELFFRLACVRNGFIADYRSRSNLDSNVTLNRAFDFIRYFPRSVQIALFAPFPEQWFGKGASNYSGALRKLVAIEMLFAYFFFPFFLYFLSRKREDTRLGMVIIFCLSFSILFAYAVPNLGTLHRFRYLFQSLFCGLSILGAGLAMETVKSAQPFERLRRNLRKSPAQG